MDNKPPLRLVDDTPWNKPAAYRPDCVELLRQRISRRKSYLAELRDDWHHVMSEIGASPISHLLVGLATFSGTILLLIVPTLVLK